jgi:hypothetical protein
MKLKRLWPVGARRLVRLFRSWGARWKHRDGFRKFDEAVDSAIKNDPILKDLRMARRLRIDEIISEVGEKS